ncbi:chemokine (C motif) receptor 1a, duplicate 1 [Austrofundulus limnaeus]|uniref:Chemokine (C motif) receptor 1a, duplicate 1 n=1 Tax=Austrofundulus limnaeus TaxID=52670 RepID=A0A2I4ARU8_AUSLI|nr:PREDICTED: chemokine XC receptor 1-like [Austrofundulus limnaeus]
MRFRGSTSPAMTDLFNTTAEYADDYPDEVCEKDHVVKFGSIATPFFFTIVFTLSLTGNILVLVILGLYENLKSLTNIFILNLAVSDLIFTIGLPFWAIYHIWGWIFSKVICKAVTFVFFTGFYSSVLFLTIMTIYRYLAVVHPLSDMSNQNVCAGVLVSGLMWTISIAAAMPSLLFTSLITIHHKDKNSLGCEYEDLFWKMFGTGQQNLFFLLAFAVMGFCYVRILINITRTRSHTKNRAVKLVFCIVAVFFVGWVPYNVVIFLRVFADKLIPPFDDCDTSNHLDYAFNVCRLIAFSHCCLNPVFYAFVGVKFRSHLKIMLRKMIRRQNSAPGEEIRMKNIISRGSMY